MHTMHSVGRLMLMAAVSLSTAAVLLVLPRNNSMSGRPRSHLVNSPTPPRFPHRGVGPAPAWEPSFTMRKEGLV